MSYPLVHCFYFATTAFSSPLEALTFLFSFGLHASLCFMAVNAEQDHSPRQYQHLEEDHILSNHVKNDVGKDTSTETAEDVFPTDHQSKQRVAVVMTSLSVRISI